MPKKFFYYKIVSEKRSTTGGTNKIAEVYRAKAGQIEVLGKVKWNTASYKGEDSTVYAFLAKNGFVSKTDFEKEGGYFKSYGNEKLAIEKL